MTWDDLQTATKDVGSCLQGHSMLVNPDTGLAKCFRCGHEIQMVSELIRLPAMEVER